MSSRANMHSRADPIRYIILSYLKLKSWLLIGWKMIEIIHSLSLFACLQVTKWLRGGRCDHVYHQIIYEQLYPCIIIYIYIYIYIYIICLFICLKSYNHTSTYAWCILRLIVDIKVFKICMPHCNVPALRDTDNGSCHFHRTVLATLCVAGVAYVCFFY